VTLRQHEGRESLRLLQKLGLTRQVASKEVLEDAAVRSVGHGYGGVVETV
jgi:hypothetical protein